MTNTFLPGSVIGILGGGSDAFSLVLQLKSLGYQVAVFSEISDSPAIVMADFRFTGKITDRNKLDTFAIICDVIILENKFVNPFAAQYLSEHYYLPQGFNLLSLSQDNYLNSLFLDDLNLNTVPNATAVSYDDLVMQTESLGFPIILKPIQKIPRKNYFVLNNQNDLQQMKQLMEKFSFFVEAKIDIKSEFAITVFKSQANDLEINILPIVQTYYNRQFELQATLTNCQTVSDRDLIEMRRIAKQIAQKEAFIGAISIQFYKAKNGMLYVKNVQEGLTKFGNIYRILIGRTQEELYLKASLGFSLPTIKSQNHGVNLYFRQSNLDDIYLQMQIKPDWDFYFYPNKWKNPIDNAGYVSIKNNSLSSIYEEVLNTDIWNLPEELFKN